MLVPPTPGPQDLEAKTQKLPEVDLDAVPAVEEPEDDRDDLAEYSFPKFAATYFQKSASHTHVRKPLRHPLLYHEDDADCSVPQLSASSGSGSRGAQSALWLRARRRGRSWGPARALRPSRPVSPSPGRPGCVERHPEVHGRPPRARALRQDAASPGRLGQGGQRPASTARLCTGTGGGWCQQRADTHQPTAPGEVRHRAPHGLTLQSRSQAPALEPHLEAPSAAQDLLTPAVTAGEGPRLWSLGSTRTHVTAITTDAPDWQRVVRQLLLFRQVSGARPARQGLRVYLAKN